MFDEPHNVGFICEIKQKAKYLFVGLGAFWSLYLATPARTCLDINCVKGNDRINY